MTNPLLDRIRGRCGRGCSRCTEHVCTTTTEVTRVRRRVVHDAAQLEDIVRPLYAVLGLGLAVVRLLLRGSHERRPEVLASGLAGAALLFYSSYE